MDRFLELAGRLDCGYYSCNFLSSAAGSPVYAPYKMFTYGDTQAAVVGVKDEVMEDVDILSAYIRQLGGSVTAEYADPAGQGRIIIK